MSLLSSSARACRHSPRFVSSSYRSLSSSTPRWSEQSKPANGTPVPADGLPSLNRPLGVRERPTTAVRSMKEKMKDLLDTEKLMAERRHLVKEATKGYFHDLNMTRKHGGKTWIAPKVLIREDKSLYLPNMTGISLKTSTNKNTTEMCFGKISVISVLGTRISEVHVAGFTNDTNRRYGSNPLYQYIQINVQENVLKSLLLKMFLRSLRRQVPVEQQTNYLVSNQNMEYVRDPMGMTNSRVGYVYLVDENLRIRWAGCADATPEEAQALESCTGVLLKRLEEKPKKGGRKKKAPVENGTEEMFDVEEAKA